MLPVDWWAPLQSCVGCSLSSLRIFELVKVQMSRLAVCLLFAVAAASDLANSTTTPSPLGNASDLVFSTTTPSPLANSSDLANSTTTPSPQTTPPGVTSASRSPCSLPPADSPGLLVSDKALPGMLADLLPGTEMLQDIKELSARLGERGGAPFALVGVAVSADVNATDVEVLRSYVERGGLLVIMGGTNTRRLLNNLFGWNLEDAYSGWWRAPAGNLSGTCFDMEEISMLEPERESRQVGLLLGFTPTLISSLPPAARAIYSSASGSHAAVAEVGAGRVVWFAADWGGETWNKALPPPLKPQLQPLTPTR